MPNIHNSCDAAVTIDSVGGADVDVFLRRQAEVSEDLQPRLVDNFANTARFCDLSQRFVAQKV